MLYIRALTRHKNAIQSSNRKKNLFKTFLEASIITVMKTDHSAIGYRNVDTVRWYILRLPLGLGGAYSGDPSAPLRREMERRERSGEEVLEYFAPTYVEVVRRRGKLVKTDRPLLYNYVFVRGSERGIYGLKKSLPRYNFMSRVGEGSESHYPYLSDAEMDNLRWVARSYCGELPVYSPVSESLREGDRVRITSGPFSGVEAVVAVRPGAGRGEVMVRVLGCMWVPLLSVGPGQYELVGLCGGSRAYTHLNSGLADRLHSALGRFYAGGCEADAQGLEAAREAINKYARAEFDSEVLRCKAGAMLLLAYRLAGSPEYAALRDSLSSLLPAVSAPQTRAMLAVTLYGCTDDSRLHGLAHRLTAAWREEPSPKKGKRQLLSHLDDYDLWLGH